MTNPPRVLVTVATYNEIENLPRLVDEIFRNAPQVDLLVIDDRSPDGTGRWCDHRAADDDRVRCLHREGKLGLGSAILAGLRHAIEHDYDFVIHMDADLSHRPKYLPNLLAAMNRDGQPLYDVVIGSRYVVGGRVENCPWWRRWMSRAVNLYCRFLLQLPARDCSGGYRCYRVEHLKKVDLSAIQDHGYAVLEELLWLLNRSGARIGEWPITFVNRCAGSSKVSVREALGVFRTVFRLSRNSWYRN